MAPQTELPPIPTPRATLWAERRDRVVVTLGYVAFIAIGVWLASHFVRTILLAVIGALLAYALYPAVRFLARFLPRWLAMVLVYLILLGSLGALLYLIAVTAVTQISSVVELVNHWLAPGTNGAPSPIIKFLEQLGLSQDQINNIKDQLITQLEGVAQSVVPIVAEVGNSLLDIVLVFVLSIYLLLDGVRLTNWLTTAAPITMRSRFVGFIASLERVVGGYIRGQLIMSSLIGVLVGAGMFLFHVPDAVLLGALAFILEFIPILGTLVSGVVCVLIALSLGWLTAVFVLAYFVVVHVIEGDIVGPRILGRALGLHPAVSIIALIAGADLFGIVGALFAAPVAGLVQVIATDIYSEWAKTHADQFPKQVEVE
jgi:predicted PurR-regulated permease PerM